LLQYLLCHWQLASFQVFLVFNSWCVQCLNSKVLFLALHRVRFLSLVVGVLPGILWTLLQGNLMVYSVLECEMSSKWAVGSCSESFSTLWVAMLGHERIDYWCLCLSSGKVWEAQICSLVASGETVLIIGYPEKHPDMLSWNYKCWKVDISTSLHLIAELFVLNYSARELSVWYILFMDL
jgi:hypothetical protein